MEDLIKRQEAIEVIHKFFREKVDYVCGERKEVPFEEIDYILECNKELSSAIKEIPTAFDVEAVVEELEAQKMLAKINFTDFGERFDIGMHQAFKEAIEIVRKGGVK